MTSIARKPKKQKEYNLHHWVCSSRGGATNDLNCEMIRKNLHEAIHQIFSNDIFPEQVKRLTEMTSKVLLPEVVQEIMEVLENRDIHNPEERYKEGAIWIPKRKQFIP